MRKNTEAQTRQKLDHIQKAAMQLFGERGMDGVSVSDICKAAGITKPTFYKYIDSKERIIMNYFEGAVESLERMWDSESDPDDHLGKVIMTVSFSLVQAEKTKPELFKKYISYCLGNSTATEKYISGLVPRIIEQIDLAKKTGQIPLTQDSVIIFESLRNIGLGVAMRWVTDPNSFSLVDTYVEEILSFLKADPEYRVKINPKLEGMVN